MRIVTVCVYLSSCVRLVLVLSVLEVEADLGSVLSQPRAP